MALPPALNELADTYPLPSNATFKGGITKLRNYVVGLLGATGDAAEARVALGIGPVISFRNRARNSNFIVNQRAKAGSVVLAAGVYGHDGWKAGAAGCSYTFAASGNDIVITITAGSLVQPIEGNFIEGGDYVMSWFGTAQGKIGAGAFAASGVTASGVTPNANLSIEFGTGTLSRVQHEPGLVPTPYERRPLAYELALCKRYYQVIGVGVLSNVTSGSPYGGAVTHAEMRTTPTVAYLSDGTTVNFAGGAGQLSVTQINAYTAEFFKTATGTGNGRYFSTYSASAEI
jgi:hypothetical protein